MYLEYLNLLTVVLLIAGIIIVVFVRYQNPGTITEIDSKEIIYPVRFFSILLVSLFFILGLVLIMPVAILFVRQIQQPGSGGWIALLKLLIPFSLLIGGLIYFVKRKHAGWISSRDRFVD